MADVDASIPLGVTGGQTAGLTSQGSIAAPNMLGMISSVAKTQNDLNTSRLFNETFAAKKKFGQIMAQAPDVETGHQIALQDPDVAGFAHELTTASIAARNAYITAMGTMGTQGQDAFSHFQKGLTAVIQDPTQFPTLKNTTLAMASSVIRPKLEQAIDYMYEGLTSGLPADPVAAREAQLQRLVGWAIAGDAGDAIPRILGANAQIDVGPEVLTGKITPPQGRAGWLQNPGQPAPAPGSFVSAGNPLIKGLPPQIAQPGGIPITQGNQGTVQPGGQPGMPPAAAAPAPAEAAAAEPPRMSADGTPWLPDGYVMQGPKKNSNVIGGVPIGPAADISTGLAANFIGPEQHEYKNSQQTLSMLYEMEKGFDTMAAGGGFMTPGTAGEARLALGRMLGTFADMSGSKDLIDDDMRKKLAAGEDIMKVTQRMGISVLSALLGSQREAADTIRNMTEKGVPGISNTPLGAKLLISSIRQATERQIEMYDFKDKWQREHGGDLTGADVAFNKLHPAEGYIRKAMDEFGLDKKGFTSEDAIKKAAAAGLIDQTQYIEAMKSFRARGENKGEAAPAAAAAAEPAAASEPAVAAPAGPPVGTERSYNGKKYRFTGGNYQDEKNWEVVK